MSLRGYFRGNYKMYENMDVNSWADISIVGPTAPPPGGKSQLFQTSKINMVNF